MLTWDVHVGEGRNWLQNPFELLEKEEETHIFIFFLHSKIKITRVFLKSHISKTNIFLFS